MDTIEKVIESAIRIFNLTLLNHNEQHGYAILSDGKDMVCIEKNLTVRLKFRGYYISDSEYELNEKLYNWLRLDKLKHIFPNQTNYS